MRNSQGGEEMFGKDIMESCSTKKTSFTIEGRPSFLNISGFLAEIPRVFIDA